MELSRVRDHLSSTEQIFLDILRGKRKGFAADVLRGGLALAEPLYAQVMSLRNKLYTRGMLKSERIDRPILSVGNLTTGGTGKTPVVHRLAEFFREKGHHLAILQRGYKAENGKIGDEAKLLDELLNADSTKPRIPLYLGSDRVKSAREALKHDRYFDLFILDDAFQHRRIQRDCDLVLIDATNPFGFDHVLPRGLLREPKSGLARAHAILITHAGSRDIAFIESEIRKYSEAPIFRCDHTITAWMNERAELQPADVITGRRVFTVCGIGNPHAFEQSVSSLGGQIVGSQRFADHHHYTTDDVKQIVEAARNADAAVLLTTGKDWVKLASLAETFNGLPVGRAVLSLAFPEGEEARLLKVILQALRASPSGLPRHGADRSAPAPAGG